eukprot:TRINITY_DN1501_c0_g1_i1.p1 TRINITY_DN1501_c0_g1~~TRINITY_DN1501_c0_g1_i1.p1  ORF type:complete len:204 (+),score=35.23 TRINITY_DN1501_c0_g1_i1:58-669(+)
MSSSATFLQRIKKEFKDVSASKDSGITGELVNDDMLHWKGSITGPKGTPYEGGVFVVDIEIPKNYPFTPPKMKFLTKIWHPNVSSVTGAICLDILKNEWSPALTLRTAMLSLQALLSTPNADDPQDAQVATQYKTDRKGWEKTAKNWTDSYAKPGASTNNSSPYEAKAKKLAEMGFKVETCLAALEKSKGDENAALEYVLNHS